MEMNFTVTISTTMLIDVKIQGDNANKLSPLL